MNATRNRVYKKLTAKAAVDPRRAFFINMLLVSSILFAVVILALMINHLNTMSFQLNDVAREESRLAERNNELQARISEMQTLGTIEERAAEAGMIAVNNYKFLSSAPTVVAQR